MLLFRFQTVAGLAQSVERLTIEREVAGSIPGGRPIPRALKTYTLTLKESVFFFNLINHTVRQFVI